MNKVDEGGNDQVKDDEQFTEGERMKENGLWTSLRCWSRAIPDWCRPASLVRTMKNTAYRLTTNMCTNACEVWATELPPRLQSVCANAVNPDFGAQQFLGERVEDGNGKLNVKENL